MRDVTADDAPAEGAGGEETRRQRLRPPRPSQCRAKMRRALSEEFDEIVKGFVAEAKRGSAAHVRLANELLEAPMKRKKSAEGTAARLLRELGED